MEKYTIKMTQEEVNIYYVVLCYINSNNIQYHDTIQNMLSVFKQVADPAALIEENHTRWVDYFQGVWLNYIDEDFIKRNHIKQVPHSYDPDKVFKYAVVFSEFEVLLLNSISGLVRGYAVSSLRRCFTNKYGGSIVFRRIFNIKTYCDTVKSHYGYINMVIQL